jgi:hypothetical protein
MRALVGWIVAISVIGLWLLGIGNIPVYAVLGLLNQFSVSSIDAVFCSSLNFIGFGRYGARPVFSLIC